MSWEQGYEAGNAGLLKAVETAKLLGAIEERERILTAVDKLKPFVDEQGQPNWFVHAAYVRAIKGQTND